MRFLILWTLLSLCTVANGQAEPDAKQTAEAEKSAKSRKAAIANELKSLGDHEYAGDYYFGDGLGVNVSFSISPNSGYVFEWHGCLGLYDRNYGSITREGDHVRLHFTFPNNQEGFEGISPKFLVVRWGPRHYLIPSGKVVEFCNAVNEGSEPREGVHGSFLLRGGDEKRPTQGSPGVPAKYQGYLLAKPVHAEIVSVGKFTRRPSLTDFKFGDTPVTINKGTNDGLRVGMKLLVTNPKDLIESVEIVKEGPNESDAVMTQMGEDEPRPKAGWQLSTRAPWR